MVNTAHVDVNRAGHVESALENGRSGVQVVCEDKIDNGDHFNLCSKYRVGKRTCWILAVVAIVAMSGSAITAAISSVKRNSIESDLESERPSQTDAYYTERLSVFRPIAAKVSSASSLVQSDTPQSKALSWMVYRDSTIQHMSLDTMQFNQRYAILVLFYACGGEEWQNFLDGSIEQQNDTPTCQWKGNAFLECDKEGSVLHLNLSNRRLIGQLPNEIKLLSSLETLDLSNNFLEGAIPGAMFEGLSHLASIQLSNNELASSIPSEIGRLQRLTTLDLGVNSLTGTLPLELVQLSTLKTFNVMKNKLIGPFFDLFGVAWSSLVSLNLDETLFSGTIPSTVVAQWQDSLEELNVRYTMINGQIPKAIETLKKLTKLYIGGPELAGSFPVLTNLVQLQELSFSGTMLTGTLPTELGLLTNLQALSLSSVSINGTIPTEIGKCTRLNDLILGATLISGTIPTELAMLPLAGLALVDNAELTGSIPCLADPHATIEYMCSMECSCCGQAGCL